MWWIPSNELLFFPVIIWKSMYAELPKFYIHVYIYLRLGQNSIRAFRHSKLQMYHSQLSLIENRLVRSMQ